MGYERWRGGRGGSEVLGLEVRGLKREGGS